jgi:hypothetical protein
MPIDKIENAAVKIAHETPHVGNPLFIGPASPVDSM